MTYEKFAAMMTSIREEISFLRKLLGKSDENGLVACVTDMVIFNYFWHSNTDMPTCDFDQMQLAIQNTVQHLLRTS